MAIATASSPSRSHGAAGAESSSTTPAAMAVDSAPRNSHCLIGAPNADHFTQADAASMRRRRAKIRRLHLLHSLWQTIASSLHRISTADPRYVSAALALYIVSLVIGGARWRGFLQMLGGDVTVGRATLATLGGIAAGNLTPGRLGGEACRIGLGRMSGRATWRQATIAAVWDRLSEAPPIIVLGLMALIGMRHLTPGWRAAAMLVGAAAAFIAGGLAIGRLRRSAVHLAGWRERLALDRVSARVFAAGVGYSCLVWLQDVLRLICATRAVGVVLSPTQIATLSMLAMLGGIAPSLAGLGPVESGLVTGLLAFGVDVPTAVAVTTIERAISYAFSTSAGAIVIALMGGRSLWAVAYGRRMPGAHRDS
jgi:uncharacterized membrane protein YbhN (UPF0104 family)